MFVTTVKAEQKLKMGVGYVYGTPFTASAYSRTHKHYVHRALVILDKNITKHIAISSEFMFARHTSKPKRSNERKIHGNELGINFVGRYFILNSTIKPYAGILVGGSWNMDKPQPDFDNSGALGTFGGVCGFRINKRSYQIDLEYRITHTSDPFNTGDIGRNFHGPQISLTYSF